MLAYSCFIVMWLFSSIVVTWGLFLIQFQRYVRTGSSVSYHKFCFGFPVKTNNHWLYALCRATSGNNVHFSESQVKLVGFLGLAHKILSIRT